MDSEKAQQEKNPSQALPLRDAFIRRKGRFQLLEKGISAAEWKPGAKLLEIGCADGAGTRYVNAAGFTVTGVDIDGDIIAQAQAQGGSFICADAGCLPFDAGSFDGLFSEAAFSVLPEKEKAAAEYARVLQPGAAVLLNDYYLKTENEPARDNIQGIPCLMGVQPWPVYRQIFEQNGFQAVSFRDEYAELVQIALSLSRAYHVPVNQVSGYIAQTFGRDGFVSDFFSQARISYCQMVFRRV